MRLSILVVLALVPAVAEAYPQFQFALGSDRCSACHFSPSGGGLLNDFGRDESGDTLSGRGDGRFLHGATELPGWFQLGGDFRTALLAKQLSGRDPTWAAFPMQADLHARVAVRGVSLNVTAGLNGASRERTEGAGPLTYVVSREHYLMYESPDGEATVRAGRFFPTFGVRTQDHTAYGRRYLDQYTLEEPYALEAGAHGGNWDAFLAGFIGNPVPLTGAGPKATGGLAYYERRLDNTAIAGNARFAKTDDDRRALIGAIGKHYLEGPGLMLIGELDVQRQSFTGNGTTRWQMLGSAQVTKLIMPGYMIGATVQRWDPDLSLEGASRNALQLDVQWFPYAHVELHLLIRGEATGDEVAHPDRFALLQAHYYL